MSTYANNLTPIDNLYHAISRWIEHDRYYDYFKRISDDYDSSNAALLEKDPRHFQKQDTWKDFPGRVLLQTHERLMLADVLMQDLGAQVKKIFIPPLVIYLLLTCFDKLGQPHEWLLFTHWLKSKKKKKERQNIKDKINENDKDAYAIRLYEEYQKIYGTKSSFFRFLREILPQSARKELFRHILIKRNDTSAVDPVDVEKVKEKYLYYVRNSYTHQIYSKHTALTEREDDDYIFIQYFCPEDTSYSVYTHKNFINKIKEAVLIGISEKIRMSSAF